LLPRSQFAGLLGDIHLAEAESPCNGITGGSFAVQYHIEETTMDAVALCKSTLTSLTFNCIHQQSNNISFVKHKRVETQIAGIQGLP
jgi:hypothetical protein